MSDIRFNQWLHQSGTGGVSQVASGAVGVGTTNPLADFYVRGDAQITGILTAGHIAMGSSITFGDNDRIYLGDGTDFQLYHASSDNNSYIVESGAGSLVVNASKFHVKNAANNEDVAIFNQAGSNQLYFSNAKKFETTNTGVYITGIVTATNHVRVTGSQNSKLTSNQLIFDRAGTSYIDNTNNSGSLSFRVSASNTVGLHIDSNANVYIPSKLVHQGDADTFIEFIGNHILFDTGGSERVRIASDGSFAVGTTSPDSALHVYKQINDRTARFQRLSGQHLDIKQTAGINSFISTGKNFEIGTTDSQDVIFDTAGSERLRITSDGQILFNGTPAFTNVAYRKFQIGHGDGGWINLARTGVPADGNHIGAIQGFTRSSDGNYHDTVGIDYKGDGTTSNSSKPTRIEFITTPASSTTKAIRMTIKSDGKVGINQESPQQQLHVSTSTDYQGIFINGNSAPTLGFGVGSATTPSFKIGVPGTNNTWFGISTGTGNANKFTMDGNGKSGFTHNPDTEALTVGGSQRWTYQANNWGTGSEGAFIDYYASGSMVRLGHVNGASGSAKHIVFYSGGTERFKIASNGNFEIKSPTNVNGEQVGKFEWWNENSAGIMSKIACVREANTKAPASLAFYTSADVDSSANNSEGDITEHLRITSAGKLQQRSLGTTTNPALSAQHLYDNGITTDGNYYLQTSSMTAPALVRCVFHDNKGWMIVMQHQCVNVNGLYLSHLQNHTGTPNHATNDFQGCSQTDGLNLTPDAMWDTFGRNGEDSRMSMYAREIQTSGGSYDETQTYSSYTGGVIWNKTEFHRLFAGNFSNGSFRTGVRVTYSNNNATLYSKKGTTWSSPSLATINNGNVDQDLYFCNGEDGGDTNWSFALMRGGTPYPRLANSGNGGGRNSITRWGIIGICEK